MLGSKKRDYKTEQRAIQARLAEHFKLMEKYIAEGMSKEEASDRAYKEMMEKKGGKFE